LLTKSRNSFQAPGQEVALLVMFDAVNPGRLDGLSMMHAIFVQADELCRKIWFHLRSMTRLELGNLPAYFLERLKNVWRTLTSRTWSAPHRQGIPSSSFEAPAS
jgi:hypothetical protein